MDEHREKLRGEYAVSHRITTRETHKNTYHVHDELEVMFVKKGTISVTVGEEKYEVHDGTLLIFSPIDLHGIVPQSEIFDRYVLYFKPEFMETFSSEAIRLLECFYMKNKAFSNRILLNEAQKTDFEVLFDQLLQCAERKEEIFAQDLEQKYLLGLVLIRMNRLYAENTFIPLPKRRKNDQMIYHTLFYIQNHMDGDLSVRTLAAVNFVDKNTLGRIFSETLGVSPAQYVLQARIVKAKHLLMNGYSLEDVCVRCGFHSLSHFSRTFKDKVGITPSGFAKQNSMQLQTK